MRNHHTTGSVLEPRSAFTLVELLIVIAMLSVLLALLLPAVGQAREKARQAVCSSHIRQIGVTLHLYAQDHQDLLPPMGQYAPPTGPWSPYWWEILPEYTGNPLDAMGIEGSSALSCPSNRFLNNYTYGVHYFNVMGYWDYPGPPNSGSVSINQVPPTQFLLADANSSAIAPPEWSNWLLTYDSDDDGINDSGNGACAATGHNCLAIRHFKGANFIFVDGQVSWHTGAEWASNSGYGNGPGAKYGIRGVFIPR
ncbi:MAG: DUF1559 domain-containing protein [Phycisphaeraceae bacterium]|nr:DUF1559 domain-containing protein [Phycisphaeraceae bacterium]